MGPEAFGLFVGRFIVSCIPHSLSGRSSVLWTCTFRQWVFQMYSHFPLNLVSSQA